MGYECPVCETPQADARHLANHMAFTAVIGDAEHEAWLDDHAPGWAEAGEAELAPRIAEHAPEGEFPQVFEDTAGGLEETDPTDPPEERSGALFDDGEHSHTHAHGHDHPHGHGVPPDPDRAGGSARGDRTAHLAGSGTDPEALDEETREVLEEARDMTREMLGVDEGEEVAGGPEGPGDADEDADGSADDEADDEGATDRAD